MSVQAIHFLRPLPPKKSTHQYCLSSKNPHENNKKQANFFLNVWKNVDFQPPPPKVYDLYTCENVDIYGWPINELSY